MTNLECAVAVLLRHREARHWTDDAVAADLLVELGLDPAGNAGNATTVVDATLVTEDQVAAAEAAAKAAIDEFSALRATLNAQKARAEPEPDPEPVAAAQTEGVGERLTPLPPAWMQHAQTTNAQRVGAGQRSQDAQTATPEQNAAQTAELARLAEAEAGCD